MEEIPLLLGNICAICYESALKEYLQKRWISCRIRRVLSCCCSRHLMAESANAFKKIVMRSCSSTRRKGGGERKNKEWRQQSSRETRFGQERSSAGGLQTVVVCLFAFSPSWCEASSSAGLKQNGRAS